ncbi:MAG: transglycosylase domain-containing protein [Solirubrobacterales bacterium]|nr:transglycosylase domain-containing protein [Solirubrobacterales bacterium]
MGVALSIVLVGVLGAVGYVVSVAASAPSLSSLKPIDKGAVSVVYAAGGERLGFIESDEIRTPIVRADMPKMLRMATVAIEDQRFYKHNGVDYEGVIRAAFKNLESGQTVEGGSTITMQLVRNLYITKERTFERKIREAKLAEQLESAHSKAWILTSYLNNVPYGTLGGRTAIGAQAGARMFFDKQAKDLTLAESALLAGLPQAPSLNNPFYSPGPAKVRRDEVLNAMAAQGMITVAEARTAKAQGLGVKANRYYSTKREAYFFDYVQQELIQKYGINTVRRGGLKVYTTLELPLQEQARAAIAGRLNETGDPSAALVSIDPKNGHIRAMASSATYGDSQLNLASQGRRQPGSTFKVMVLMTALRKGIDPASTFYVSKPLDLKTPYGPWKVSTYAHSYGGSMNLVSATLQSDNTVYAQLDLDIGPEEVRQTAYDMGITTKLDGFPAEGLGGLTLGVSPLEMANAYATIASGGWRNTPTAVLKVVFPGGKTEGAEAPKRTKVFSDGVTYAATQILEQNVQGGTGTAAQIGCPAGGKTGTTDSFNDAWFVGFTPNLATSVWVGFPQAQIEMTNVHGISVAGGTFPAQIWGDYMTTARGEDCADFPYPTESAVLSPFFGKYASTGQPIKDPKKDKKPATAKKPPSDATGGLEVPTDTTATPDPDPTPQPPPDPDPTPEPPPDETPTTPTDTTPSDSGGVTPPSGGTAPPK